MEAAVRNQSLCILLDDFDAFLPVGATSGDAASPVLYGLRSYLQTLISSIQQRQEIPFPSNNPLYNLNGHSGVCFSVRLCVVAVTTCSGDSPQSMLTSMGVYRLPSLTSQTRLSAFQWAFQQEHLELSLELVEQLPFLAASAVWVRGKTFLCLAQHLRCRTASPVSLSEAKNSFHSMNTERGKVASTVQFVADTNGALFGSVGGNHEAKAVLEDALALDPARRKMLSSFGMAPPTGILLYGPPGVGKTLLAKAVARLLHRQTIGEQVGGAFISLSSTDIVRSAVGEGEKMVASAFETARLNSPAVVFI